MDQATSLSGARFRSKTLPVNRKRQDASGSLLRRFLRRRVSDRDRMEFCTQLAVMLKSRITLHRGLEVLARQTKNEEMRNVVERLAREVQKGNSFDKVLASQPEVFDNLFVVTAEVGQESGRLADVLGHLAQHLEKMTALGRKFRQALTYPARVVSVACFAVAFLLIFIVPTFAEMFKSFQVELPASTRFVLSLSSVLSSYGVYALAALVAAWYVSRATLRKPAVRRKLELLIFRIPWIGDVVLKTHVARFCRTLGTLLQAQVSLVDALGVSQRIATNSDIRTEIGGIIKCVRQGLAMTDPLMSSKLFPPMVVQMIAVGEETSELDTMLLKVADYYEKEIDGSVDALSSVIEPVIVVFLGLLVAGILVSMYLPMFDLVNLMGNTG